MSENSNRTIKVANRERCAVCESQLVAAIDLPKLPLTDSYCSEPVANPLPGIDQRLIYCQSCGHGQLESLVSPLILYGSNYCFRASASATARKGTDFFLSVLDEIEPGRKFRCVLDVGCNDLYLLDRLAPRAEQRIGIDPIWKGRESECTDKSLFLIGDYFEELDLSGLPVKPDIVVCRHTLEHILDPVSVLRTLLEIGSKDTIYLFEFPGFDGLLRRLRFDQVFHQHAHYFTTQSFLKLLDVVGGRYLIHRENFHDWGSTVFAFMRRNGPPGDETRLVLDTWSLDDIDKRYQLFRKQMTTCCEILDLYSNGPIYGYGASQMLPVLAYHMGTNFSELSAILDDDPSKDGIGYWNLPVGVTLSNRVDDLAESAVLITAIDNVQPIMTKLLVRRPKHILFPFHNI